MTGENVVVLGGHKLVALIAVQSAANGGQQFQFLVDIQRGSANHGHIPVHRLELEAKGIRKKNTERSSDTQKEDCTKGDEQHARNW